MNIITLHPETPEHENALKAFAKALKMKFEVVEEKPYNPDFVARVNEVRKQIRQGKTIKIDLYEIWKD